MATTLPLKVSSKKKDETEFFEGTVSMPGLRPAKLIRRKDNTTQFTSRASLMSTARSFAKKWGFDGIEETGKKAAAKKSVKTSRAKKSVSSTST